MSLPNGFYRTTCFVMTGVIVSGVAAWMTFGVDKITRDELVQHRIEDRQYNQELKSTVDALDVTVRDLGLAVTKLTTILEERR